MNISHDNHATINMMAASTTIHRPRSPLTIPSHRKCNMEDGEDASAKNLSPPVSVWSADESSSEGILEDELYIRRVFSFDEWEYTSTSKSPLHREPISFSDVNRYQDSLRQMILTPATTRRAPSLFQEEIWDKKFQEKESEMDNGNALSRTIPSPQSAFRRFQEKPLPLDTTFATEPTEPSFCCSDSGNQVAPWCPSISREGSEDGSFVHCPLQDDHFESSTCCISIPEYVMVPQLESKEDRDGEDDHNEPNERHYYHCPLVSKW